MDNKNSIDDELGALAAEEVKAIGEIELGPSKQEEFLNRHYKKLIVGSVVLAVVVGVGICLATFRRQHLDAGAHQLFAVAKVVSPGVTGTPSTYDAKELSAVQTEYAGTDSATTAALMEGLALLQEESTAEAGIARLEELAATSQNELVRARALSALAFCYMSKGKADAATEAWKKVTQLPANAYTSLAYISLGDLARNAGDRETARSYYTMLAKECPAGILTRSQVAEMRLMLLDADEPVPVKPLPTIQPQQPLSPYAPLAPGQQQGGGSIFDSVVPSAPGL